MKKLILLIPVFFLSSLFIQTYSQTLSGAFTVTGAGYSTAVVTDYQCVGLNPANLGWRRNDHLMNVGFAEADISIYSEPLKRALVDELFNTGKVFTEEERQQAVTNFTDTKLQMEGNISGIGLSLQNDKIGGFGFAIRERLVWDSNLNEQSADLLFNGYNSSYFDTIVVDPQTGDSIGVVSNPAYVTDLFEGTKLEMLWFREFNLSYGRRIFNTNNFTLYAGVGIKYLQGYSVFNYSYSGGVMRAYSALTPVVGVDYGTDSPSKINNDKYQSVGQGWGLDFGLSAMLFSKLRLAVAVTDFGEIKWDGNVYEGKDALLEDIESSGLDNYNIFDLDDNMAFDNIDWGDWEGLESKTTKLPMNFRAGAAFLLNKKYEFGGELYLPVNDVPGSYDKLIVGFGARLMPVKWFRGSIGVVSGGETGTNIPVGISFFPFNNDSFSWELGVAIRDITTYFQQDKPTVSIALGFLRFSFGSLQKKKKVEEKTDESMGY
ncbi:MAG: hypothetical protein B6D61_04950 [Bacteroidetes bacterium 4484_249]|nr:MAG: hypothetical protein B6D61_04950 [Bacteroidetes bacterium 4484_249]